MPSQSRLIRWLGRHREEVAIVDATGGTIEAIKLTDNNVPKVLLRLARNGVSVEMALTLKEAEDFHEEYDETVIWVREGGREA